MPKKKRGPSPKKHHLKMAVLSESEAKATGMTVINPTEEFAATGDPFIYSARGRVILECGECGRVLLQLDSTDEVHGGIWKCPGCGAFNTTLQ